MNESEGANITLYFDLGGEHAKIQHIRCTEELGRPFTITVEVLVRLGEIDVLEQLGKPVSLRVREWDDTQRYLHGLLTESEFTRESRLGYHYRLTARPFTYYLDQNRAFAIFQDQNATDIIKQVLEHAGVRDVDFSRLSRSYPPRAYCVQYGESDFAFISRLMEEEGIYYFYRHEADKHVMVLCDGASSHAAANPGTLHYNPVNNESMATVLSSRRQRSTFQRLTERVGSGGEAKVTMRDFDLTRPERPLEARWTASGQHTHDEGEVFEYPGRYTDEGHGGELSKALLVARRAERQLYFGDSQSLTLTCGGTLHLDGHPAKRFNADYLLVRVIQNFTVQAPDSQDEEARAIDREPNTRFEAIPATVPFHARRTVPRPQVRGLETAMVSGPEGETIYTDQYGRVKVRFPWDRSGSAGERSTCWIRVAQFGNLGSVILPRVGQEVMVDFLHGNPDRPIVCGWVFNAALMPTYDLPAHKTRALWRTKRYGAAGDYPDVKDFDIQKPGVNELRFEDKGGSEEVFLHAERDMNTRVRFDQTNQVGHDQDEKVGHNRTAYVGVDETTTVDKNQTLTVGAKQTETIKGDREVKVNATDALKIGQSQTIEAGTTIEVKANTSITFKVGQSSIVIDQSGVTIKGMSLKIEAQLQASIKAVMAELKADAMTTISGGLVSIN